MAFRDRIVAYMTKALREAKLHTSWLSPDEEYEAAVERFVRAILDRRRPNLFLPSFEPFQARVAELGIYNSLAQLVIKITAPGVPDFYQGTELWDLALVDPDNRRPVDYAKRREVLADLGDAIGERPARPAAPTAASRCSSPAARWPHARSWRAVYEHGDYVPLSIAGGAARLRCSPSRASGPAPIRSPPSRACRASSRR